MSNLFDFGKYIKSYEDFPEPGIIFRDLSPLLRDAVALQEVTAHMAKVFSSYNYDLVCGIDARGLIFGSLLALHEHKGFIMVRKAGKLPGRTITRNYDLEYGKNSLEIQDDAIQPGQKVLIIDDVLATGGTAAATANLVESMQGEVVALGFIIELKALNARSLLGNYPVETLISY